MFGMFMTIKFASPSTLFGQVSARISQITAKPGHDGVKG